MSLVAPFIMQSAIIMMFILKKELFGRLFCVAKELWELFYCYLFHVHGWKEWNNRNKMIRFPFSDIDFGYIVFVLEKWVHFLIAKAGPSVCYEASL